MILISMMNRVLVIIICYSIIKIVQSLDFSSFVTQGESQLIRLKAHSELLPGTVLNLPISIPEHVIKLNGKQPPRLKAITSANETGFYSLGDRLLINLEFYSAVLVFGTPSITLNTGCHSPSCVVQEIQMFTCVADRGYFSIKMEGQSVMNIEANTTASQLELLLKQFNGINSVAVEIIAGDDNPFNADRICSSAGNDIYITFLDVDFPQYNGNVPPIDLNRLDDDPDFRTKRSMGVETNFLKRTQPHSIGADSFVYLSERTTELTMGVNRTDSICYYIQGNLTTDVSFLYTVAPGDTVDNLDVISINFDEGYISSRFGTNVSTEVPLFGIGGRYLSSDASSLSFNFKVGVASSLAHVVDVTSPNASGLYTAGDALFVDVNMDLAVKINDPELMTLELRTGIFTRKVPFHALVNYHSLRFLYIVQPLDTSPSLDVTSEEALSLNGAFVYRMAGSLQLAADTSLPVPGGVGSLPNDKQLIINTQVPVIIFVDMIAAPRVYTSGDLVNLIVKFSTDISVKGTPRIALSNTPRQLSAHALTAPFLPSFTYRRSKPGGVTQLKVNFVCNLDFEIGDTIVMSLPDIYIESNTITYLKNNALPPQTRGAPVTVYSQGNDIQFTGLWDDATKELTLTASTSFPRFTAIDLLVEGRTSLYVSSYGISAPFDQKLFLFTSYVDASSQSGFLWDTIESVGFSNASIEIFPAAYDEDLTITLYFSVPESLDIGDSLIFNLAALDATSSSDASGVIASNGVLFRYAWNVASALLNISAESSIPGGEYSLVFAGSSLHLRAGQNGIGPGAITFSTKLRNNGNINDIPMPYYTSICSIPDNGQVNVDYLTKRPGAATAVKFSWTSGPTGHAVGDEIRFQLSHLNSLNLDLIVLTKYINGAYANYLNVSINDATVSFAVLDDILPNEMIEITIDESVGMIAPSNGVQISRGDSFLFSILSSLCEVRPRVLAYSSVDQQIVALQSATVSLYPGNFVLSVSTEISIHLLSNSPLYNEDSLIVTLPDFDRNISITSYDSVAISSNVLLTTRFNRLLSRLEFTLMEDLIGNSISIDIKRPAGFSTPSSSISNSAYKLSISSANSGAIDEFVMTGQCIGFCSSAIDFTNYLIGEEVTMSISFSFSLNLIKDQQLLIISERLFNVSNMDVLVSISGSSAVASFDGIVSRLNISLPFDVPAGTLVTVTVNALEFTENPKVQLEIDEEVRLNGRASVLLTCPEVFERPSMYSAGLEVNVDDINTVILQFVLNQGNTLLPGSAIYVELKDFVYFGDDITQDIADSPNEMIDKASTTWDPDSFILTYYFKSTLPGFTGFRVVLSNFQIPDYGIAKDSNLIKYSTSIGPQLQLQSSFFVFSTVTKIVRVTEAVMDVTLKDGSMIDVQYISLRFYVTDGLEASSLLIFTLPFVAQSAQAGSVLVPVSSAIPASAQWTASLLTMTVTVTAVTPELIEMEFDVASLDFKLTTAGIPETTVAPIDILDPSSNKVAMSDMPVTCFGICKANLEPTLKIPGRPTDYAFSATFNKVLFSPNSKLRINLLGFSSLNSVETNISCSSGSNTDIAIAMSWSAVTAELQLHYIKQSSSLQPLSNISCMIRQQDIYLVTPRVGVRPDDLSLITLTPDGSQTFIGGEILVCGNIGSLVESDIAVEPRLPNHPVKLTFTFTLRDKVQEGDEMNLYLPNFVIPNRPLQVFGSVASFVGVVGTAAVSQSELNVDQSVYFENMIGYLTIQFNKEFNAQEEISFYVAENAGIISPRNGIFAPPLPWLSLSSDSSPIASSSVSNITRIGTLSPASLNLVELSVQAQVALHANFTLSCPLLEGDVISISHPAVAVSDISALVASCTGFKDNIKLNASWSQSLNTIDIALAKGFVPSGPLSFACVLQGAALTTQIVYGNDSLTRYELKSMFCPVDSTMFDISNAHILEESTAVLVASTSSYWGVFLSFDIVPLIALQADDKIEFSLNNFMFNDSSIFEAFDYSVDCNVLCSAVAAPVAGGVKLSILLQQEVAADAHVTIVTLPYVVEFQMTVNEVHKSDIYLEIIRNVPGSDPVVPEVIGSSYINMLQPVPYLLSASIEISTPKAGSNSAINLEFSLSIDIDLDTTMEFYFPFFEQAEDAQMTWTFSSDDLTQQFDLEWNAAGHSLIVVPKIFIPATTIIFISVDASQGILVSTLGVPVQNEDFTILLFQEDEEVLYEIIEEVTAVPYIVSSYISFLSCDTADAYLVGGDPHAIQLEAGHELSGGDIGSKISIAGVVYTIEDFSDDILYIVEEYIGPRVFLGAPLITFSSPSYRFANYLSGSGTDTLLFQYKVARGDASTDISLYSSTGSFSIDLNGGELLRKSQDPRLPAILNIVSLENGEGRNVNTDYPSVVEVYTTSDAGIFSAGQVIDIWIKFSESVTLVQEAPFPLPQLLLFLNGSVTRYATYEAGSRTADLVFLYTVLPDDFEVTLLSSILDAGSPISQPLRISTGNTLSVLRRSSDIPLLDASLSLVTTPISFPTGQRLIGVAAKIVSLSVISTSVSGTSVYTAGDYIDISVKFDKPVILQLNSLSPLYIELDVGRTVPGVAEFLTQKSETELVFQYLVTSADSLPHGLILHCTCQDYLKRSFIRSNLSSIISENIGLPASLLIAHNDSMAARMVDANLRVDTIAPSVVQISSNTTSGIYTVGSSIVISVTYSSPVVVTGIATLLLKGQKASSCRASFLSGNKSFTLNFLYRASYDSGTATLDCSTSDSIMLRNGHIYRWATIPTIIADNTLPSPGEPESLGRELRIDIDTTIAYIVDSGISYSHRSRDLLASSSLSLNIPNTTFKALFEACACEAWYNEGLVTRTPLREFVASESGHLLNMLSNTFSDDAIAYDRFLLLQKYNTPIARLSSELRTCFNWWSGYQIADKLQLSLTFNRPVSIENAYLKLPLGSDRNVASLSPYKSHYSLLVSKLTLPQTERNFAFRYSGSLTRCLPLSSSSEGIYTALNEVDLLREAMVTVSSPVINNNNNNIVQHELLFGTVLKDHLVLLTGDSLHNICNDAARDSDVALFSDRSQANFIYDIADRDTLVLKAKSDMSAGLYTLHFRGAQLRHGEANEDSFSIEQLSQEGISAGKATGYSNTIGKVTLSTIAFGTVIPASSSNVQLDICRSVPFARGDVIEVHLPEFDLRGLVGNSSAFRNLHSINASVSLKNSSVSFTVYSAKSCISNEGQAINFPVTLRSTGIYRNDPGVVYSIISKSGGDQYKVPFQTVQAVGITSCAVSFNETRPNFPAAIILTVETLLPLSISEDSLQVILPGFYSFDVTRAKITVLGPLEKLFSGRWSNESSTLYLSPKAQIPAGAYRLTIVSDDCPIKFSPHGMSNEFAPMIQVRDPVWLMDATVIQSFPIVLGYYTANASMTVESSYAVTSMKILLMFSSVVEGPALAMVHLPSIYNIDGFFTSSLSNSPFSSVSWFGFNHTFVFYSESGWSSGVDITLELDGLVDFFVNDLGMTYGLPALSSFGVSAKNTKLDFSPLPFDVAIPVISNASFFMLNTQSNPFFRGFETVVVSMSLNLAPSLRDIFTVKIDGIGINFTSAIITDLCYEVRGARIESDPIKGAVSYVSIGLSNGTSHCYYRRVRFLSLEITNVELGDRPIRQYGDPFVSNSWTTSNFSSDFRVIDRSTWIGLYTSSITLLSPYSGQISPVHIKLLTSMNLLAGDEIILSLPGFASNGWTSAYIPDANGRAWQATFYGTTFILRAPQSLPPSALEFNTTWRLPATGVHVRGDDTLLVTIRRTGITLPPQRIRYISPVGLVDAKTSIHVQRRISSSLRSNQTGMSIAVSLQTLSPLFAGDKVLIYLPSLSFDYPSLLQLHEAYKQFYEVRVISEHDLVINVFDTHEQNTIDLITVHSNVIGLSQDQCSSLTGCQAMVSIESTSNPVANAVVPVLGYLLTDKTSLSLGYYNLTVLDESSVGEVDLYANNSNFHYKSRHYDIAATFHFELQSPLTVNSSISIDISDILRSVAIGVESVNTTNPLWIVQWSDNKISSEITLRPKLAPVSGVQSVFIHSSAFAFLGSVYNDSQAVKFRVSDGVDINDESTALISVGWGIANASLSFSNPRPGEETSVRIKAYPYPHFFRGDVIVIVLPGGDFSSSSFSLPEFPGDVAWVEGSHSLVVTAEPSMELLDLELDGFMIPTNGINSHTNTPLISLNRTRRSEYFPAVSFYSFDSVAAVAVMNISFSFPAASAWTDLTITIAGADFVFHAGDRLQILLPQFASSSELMSIIPSTGKFSVSWSACDELLSIVAEEDLSTDSLQFLVSQLRVPIYGISLELSKAIEAFVISEKEQVSFEFPLIRVERIFYSVYSSLRFSPAAIGSDSTLTLQFTFSENLIPSDAVTVSIPSLALSSSCLSTSSNSLLDSVTGSVAGQFQIVLKEAVPAGSMLIANYSHCVDLPRDGFPKSGLSMDSNTFSVTGKNGLLGLTAFMDVSQIGIVDAKLFYTIIDASKPLALRLDLLLSSDLSVGDTFAIKAPFVVGSASAMNLSIAGDNAENLFRSYFSGVFHSSSHSIVLTCTSYISKRRFSVFVSVENNLMFQWTSISDHYISANISGVGYVSDKALSYEPSSFPLVSDLTVDLQKCIGGNICDYYVSFRLESTLLTGEFLTLSSENWEIPENASLRVSGSAGNSLEPLRRGADNIASLQLLDADKQGHVELLGNGYVYTFADEAILSADLVIRSDEGVSDFTITTTSAPSVRRVSLYSQWEYLFCLDEVYISVAFDRAIAVINEDRVKLLLNTGEYANYFGMAAQDEIIFKYTLMAATDVSALAVGGPAALELYSFSSIVDYSDTFRLANLSISAPFELYNLAQGARQPIPVVCTSTASVISIEKYSLLQEYSNGDLVDVAIQFDRPIYVSGVPQLILTNADDGSNFAAKYVNVSSHQWLEIYVNGEFSFVYGDEASSCVNSDSISDIYRALAEIPGLQPSFPLTVEQIGAEQTGLFLLTFDGVAPLPLQYHSESCDIRASGRIQIDDNMLSKAVFRLPVSSEYSSGVLTFVNASALQLSDGSAIFISSPAFRKAVDLSISNSLNKPLATINNRPPRVLNISSDFYSTYGRTAVNGDTLIITIEMSSDIAVVSPSDVMLEVNIHNYLDKTINSRSIPLHSYDGPFLIFRYFVRAGDYCQLLDTTSSQALFTHSSDARVMRKSAQPVIEADLDLPAPGHIYGLSASHVSINATELPIILSAYINPFNLGATAGTYILINVQFSSQVSLVDITQGETPFVMFSTPANARMVYESGSGSDTLVFGYNISAVDASGNVSFIFNLEQAFLEDLLHQRFANLTSHVLVTVHGLVVNTTSPRVVKVDCNCSNGIYYPGQVLDMIVEFDKAVLVLHGSPSLLLFVPTQPEDNLLAEYSYGNGSKVLHFSYLVPSPNINMFPHEPHPLDYAGVSALIHNLNGASITDVSQIPLTLADLYLPPVDQSFLGYQRNIYISYALSKVVKVYTSSGDKVLTAGDTLRVSVQFSTPVMFFDPAPLLLFPLNVGNTAMKYVGGNYSNELHFEYFIKEGDKNARVDYVDTRASPYNTVDVLRSYPLVAYDDLQAGDYGKAIMGIYMASPVALFPIEVTFPLPGAQGSLWSSSHAVIDTTAPTVTLVTTEQRSGTYGQGIQLNIFVHFDLPVVVAGCPKLVFVVSKTVRYASYSEGSGGTTLVFTFVISKEDYMVDFDYVNPSSLHLGHCHETKGINVEDVYIKRVSEVPTIYADLTLPLVNVKTSVVSPLSILGSGVHVNLAGGSAYPHSLGTIASPGTIYSFGDVVSVYVKFSGDVFVEEYLTWLSLTSGLSHTPFRSAYYAGNHSDVSEYIFFSLLAEPYDSEEMLSYDGIFAFESVVPCAFFDPVLKQCAAQNLPAPLSVGKDNLSPKHISIETSLNTIHLMKLEFVLPRSKAFYSLGDVVSVLCTFSGPVTVSGQPRLRITLEDALELVLDLDGQSSPNEVVFSHVFGDWFVDGEFQCGLKCRFDVFNGEIVRTNNFLPLVPVALDIPGKMCLDTSCTVIHAPWRTVVPVVTRVHSNATGVRSLSELLFIFVEYSSPVYVNGAPELVLELPGEPSAIFRGIENAVSFNGKPSGTVLLFTYQIRAGDFTSALDYATTESLRVAATSYDVGIFSSSGNDMTIPVSVTLPLKGSVGSLGRESYVVIDQNRPLVVSMSSEPEPTTCGDTLIISIVYSQTMLLQPLSSLSAESDLKLLLSLHPTGESYSESLALEADFYRIVDNVLSFSVFISSQEPLGVLTLRSSIPLILDGFKLVSRETKVASPLQFPANVVESFEAHVVEKLPVVVSVSSPNTTTTYAYGVGDVLTLQVRMNVPIRVNGTNAKLLLNLDGVMRIAQFTHLSDSDTVLNFLYAILGDDHTDMLQTIGTAAFIGDVYQISTCDRPVPANMTLPYEGYIGSLSYCCQIKIDSSPPYISALIPLKAPGTYGENETILIIARFNSPVLVLGEPQLLLAVSDSNSSRLGVAKVARFQDVVDLPIEISSTDVLFEYTIQESDLTISLAHAGAAAVRLPDSDARILQQSQNPAFPADLTLREAGDYTLVNGTVERQWKYHFFSKLEVFLRDIEHSQPELLTVTMDHAGIKSTLFANCCKRQKLGYRKSFYTSGTATSRVAVEEGNGEDLYFSDTTAPNIAGLGRASQSSTVHDAALAIDGKYSALVGDGSVTETVQESDAWWKLTFQTPKQVQTVQIYERLPEQWIRPIVDYTVKGIDRVPRGYYRLRFSNFDINHPLRTIETTYIAIGDSDSNVQKAIMQLGDLGTVFVSRTTLPLCLSDGNGCGQGFEHGYGNTYRLVFETLIVEAPMLEVIDIKYPGESLTGDGLVDPNIQAQTFALAYHVDPIQSGHYEPVSKQYQGLTRDVDLSNTNQWLTPFWVFMFNSSYTAAGRSAPSDILSSKTQAVWYGEFSSIETVLTITLPAPRSIACIKIQRIGYGQLSLAEVLVYSSALNTLNAYAMGSPVQAYELGSLYQPLTPFAQLYSNIPYFGSWVVQIKQQQQQQQEQGSSVDSSEASKMPRGSISEAVIVVTDLAGMVTAYYQDLRSIVTALPRYGSLQVTTAGSPMNYRTWQETFGLLRGQVLLPLIDRKVPVGVCAASELRTPACPQLVQQVGGDLPPLVILRRERVVVYTPYEASFAGQDFFTYQVLDGRFNNSLSNVALLVQPCRQSMDQAGAGAGDVTFVTKYWTRVKILCDCAPSAGSLIGSNSQCVQSREALCSTPDLRGHFADMCSACYGSSDGSTRTDPSACRSMTIRATSLLLMRGMCPASFGSLGGGAANATSWVATIRPECLQPKGMISSPDSVMRRDYIPSQRLH